MGKKSRKKSKGCALITSGQILNSQGLKPRCPICSTRLDGVTGATIELGRKTPSGERAIPKPGSLTLCVYCGTLLEFDETMDLEQAPLDAWAKMHPEQRSLFESIRASCHAKRN